MRKLHLAFGIIAIIMTLAAILISCILYATTPQSEETSFPTWTIFVLVGIYYAIGIACLACVWLVVLLILRRTSCKN